ncbi:MAG: hypothetical protein AW12_02517 [Candidatus Accumulibacter sp. BA-94]|nr:MAG: hypothetical protein AW12_02517 [Candidatus Accumulibacter sp. BA-94]
MRQLFSDQGTQKYRASGHVAKTLALARVVQQLDRITPQQIRLDGCDLQKVTIAEPSHMA